MFAENDIYSQHFFLVSALAFTSFVIFIMGCVCGCRRKVPKNELLGLAGMVKIRNPDDQISNSHIPCAPDSVNSSAKSILKRVNGGTATRSLPDLPVDQKWSAGDIADTNSDLYATVEDGRSKAATSTAVPESVPVASASADDTAGPYAQLDPSSEHPYAQLDEPGEHRYARVGESGSNGPRPSTSSTSSAGTPPSRRSVGELSNGEERIAAASAVAGTVPANRDLPYMTPPLAPQPQPQPQHHFSGDSQDSTKGYTSISVREPLSRIKDGHYSTVSDVDSDDMYAAIEDRRNDSDTYARIGIERREYQGGSDTYARIGGSEAQTPGEYNASGSETYAQIGPRPTLDNGPGYSALRGHEEEEEEEPCASDPYARVAPRPGSAASAECVETYAQLAPTHARQESWSSASGGGSPARGPRRTVSPLPDPPPLSEPPPAMLMPPDSAAALDALYAKVVKRRPAPSSLPHLPNPPQENGDVDGGKYESVRSLVTLSSHYETLEGQDLSQLSEDPPYEKLQPSQGTVTPVSALYASVHKGETSKSPG